MTLSVRAGERVALIGPNGAGKSTLLRCLAGLQGGDPGRVSTLGVDDPARAAPRERRRLRRRIGFVLQSPALVRQLSALSNVVHGLLGDAGSWRGWNQLVAPADWRERALDALDEVGLAHRASSRAGTLSGGQQQRVAIARSLVREPRLLFADEPAASLDPAAGNEVMQRLGDMSRRRGAALVFTTHDMAHALAYATRVVALRDGRVLLDRPASALAAADALANVFEAPTEPERDAA